MLFSYALLRPLAMTLFSLASLVANLLNSQWNTANSSRVWISCLAFASTNLPRLADDMKCFLALGYSLNRAYLKASQSGKVASNSGIGFPSLLYHPRCIALCLIH